MQLVSYNGGQVGYVQGDLVVDLGALVGGYRDGAALSPMRRLLQHWDQVQALLPAPDQAPTVPLASVRLDPPIPDPTKIVAAPVNYRDHKSEMELTVDISDLAVFLKAPSSLIGEGGAIELPYSDRRFDQEGELAVVIGKQARNVTEQDALNYVVGYSCLLDITMRGQEDRSTRKSFDTFTPMGPTLVTVDEAPPADAIALDCTVGDEHRQSSNTKNLIWSVARLVSYISSVMTLEVGDIIATGTPSGVGPLTAGEKVSVTLAGIGTLTVDVINSPTQTPSTTSTRATS